MPGIQDTGRWARTRGLIQIAEQYCSSSRPEKKALTQQGRERERLDGAHHNKIAPITDALRRERQSRAQSGERGVEMASSSSCPPPSPRLSHLLPVLVAAVVLLGRGGEARQPAPLHGVVRSMAFDEGYTQLFGSGNLALRREGKRVHLALDESTGECCPASAATFMRFRCNMRVRIALVCFTNGSLLFGLLGGRRAVL